MTYRIFLTVSLLACSFMSLRAQDADSTKDEGKLTFSGYIDTYYNHAFNNPGSGNLMGNAAGGVFGGAPAGRAFDRLTDQFALGLVQTKLEDTLLAIIHQTVIKVCFMEHLLLSNRHISPIKQPANFHLQ
jgi:hypothetical protein